MAPTRVILMSCGSYNPPTNMHLRMFEIARDHLHRMGTHVVVGGVISPVHDAYAKKELASATHRCAMLRLALQNSDWIRLSTWETRQNCWTKTRLSLQHHQNLLNSVLFDTNDIKHHMQIEDLDWIPEDIKNSNDTTPIQIKLLCGADLLESFGTCDLWAEEDIDAIVGEHGLVVITREGSNPNKFIYDSDILSRHMHNIYIVTEWIPNEVSSSRIRRALKRGESVRYLLQDAVIHYIYKSGIYDAKATTTTIKLELTSPNANNYLTIDPKYQSTFLTPSPSDVTMDSPSPVEIISIDVPDSVLRKNLQNATGQFIAPRHCGLEEAREKFINAIVAENGNAKLLANAKAAYPGQAKQIIATESGESRILEEVGLPDEDRKVAKVQPRQLQAEADDVAESSANVSVGAKEVRNQESGSAIGSPGRSECLSASSKSDARRECALSDFSVDKEEYRMREGGLEDEEDPDELIADEEWKETQARMKEFAGEGGAGGEEVRKDRDVERADVLDDSVGEVSESLSSSRALVLVSEASSKEQGEGGELIVQTEETVGLIVENEELVDLIVHQKNHVELIVEREEPVDIILQRTEQVGLIVDKEDRVDLIVQRQERVDVIVKPKDYGEVIVEKDPLNVILQQSSYGGIIVDGKDSMDFTVNSMTLQEESVELIVHEKDPALNVQVKDLDFGLQRSSSRDSIVQRSPSRDSIVQRSPSRDSIVQRSPSKDSIVQRSPSRDSIVQRSPSKDSIVQRSPSRDSIVQRSPSRDSIVQRSPSRDSIVQESPSRDSIVQRSPSQDSILKGSPSKDLIVQRSPTNDITELFQEQDLTAIKKMVSMQDPDKHAKSSVCKFSPVEETLEPSSSVSDDNTSVRAQSVIDVELLSAKDDHSPDPEEVIGEVISKRDSNLEIDGKYLKSIVNSRKSPRKTKSGQLRAFSDDNVRRSTSGTQDLSSRSESKSSAVKAKSEADKYRSDRESARPRVPVSSRIQELAQECDTRKIQRYGPLKGSLDSVMTASETRIIPRRKPKAAKEAFSKKSKSYESFKRVQEVFLEEPLKTDSSTSQLITANPLDTQTDEFCSVCCYVNELAMRAEHEEIGSPNQETFYTLQSNCSSLIDEDSTECDICSSWNLQESSEALDRKLMTVPDDQPLCEVCEICCELGAAYDPNQDLLEHPEFIENQIPPPGLLKSSKDLRFVDECPTDPYVDEDSFEIENCGFQSGTESTEDRGQFPSENDLIDELGKESRPFYLRTTTHTPPTRDRSREKYLIPKDEVALSNSGGTRKIGRKGSLLKKKIDDSISAAQDKRRYSSADNLQVAKVFAKGSDKFVRSKGTKLIGSADNIRTSRSSRRCKSLQRSADNVRYIDSSTDNLDSLAESLGKEDEFDGSIDWSDRPKVRDNETVKMILTKHGIKIISEKETAL